MTTLIRAGAIKGYDTLMRSLGADPERLLRQHGIPPESLEDEEALIPLRAMVDLSEASAIETGCPDFGLRLAQTQDISLLGPLALAMRNAPDVEAASQIASRYLYVQSPGIVFSVRRPSPLVPGAVELRVEIHLSGQPVLRQSMDQSLGDAHRIISYLAGRHYDLRAVALPHAPVAPVAAYARFFGAPVLIAQEYGGLHVSPETLATPLREVNAALRQIALDHITRNYGDPDQKLSTRVRLALRQTLSTTQGSKDAITELLAIHPRTLQRRLASEGTSFEALREDVRREVALRYLSETRVPLSQLTGLLGLFEQSALTRCCKRWFGVPPKQLRQQYGVSA